MGRDIGSYATKTTLLPLSAASTVRWSGNGHGERARFSCKRSTRFLRRSRQAFNKEGIVSNQANLYHF